ncbi:MAG: hypothetical protein DWQ36_15335 [Acidobacteria bacterium]|nr:MAG: hypothetical protein DWQ36_15335 [Acidobacteriota bacterium]
MHGSGERHQRRTSPLVWVACGCAVAVFVIGLVVALVVVQATSKARELAREMQDPAAREERARETLNAARLPDGYHPMMSFSLPFVMEVALLSDQPPDENGEPQPWEERGFLYLEMLSIGNQQEELRAFFEGRTNDPRALRSSGINVRVREVIARGEVDRSQLDGAAISWVAHRGSFDAAGAASDGITTLILIECGEKRRLRMGIWFAEVDETDLDFVEQVQAASAGATTRTAPSAATEDGDGPEEADGVVDWTGTPADGAAIAELLEPLRPCA